MATIRFTNSTDVSFPGLNALTLDGAAQSLDNLEPQGSLSVGDFSGVSSSGISGGVYFIVGDSQNGNGGLAIAFSLSDGAQGLEKKVCVQVTNDGNERRNDDYRKMLQSAGSSASANGSSAKGNFKVSAKFADSDLQVTITKA